MVKSLFTGVSGLKAHQQRMDVIGNNIANVNTVGYKTDVVTFADVYYQTKRSPSAATATLGGINPRQAGYGVKVSAVTANFSQSGYNYTDSKTDIALDGKGFFQVMDGAGNIYYTRAGNFTFDDQGYLVNADGYHVLGVSGESQNVTASSDIIRAVIPNTDNNRSSATKTVNDTQVTVSVSAPSKYTDMSVAFKHANFPYATYANNTLTIFFNTEEQYNSQEDFDRAIQTALQAGGVNLPEDVELSVSFDTIPDDVSAAAAKNKVDDIKFTTEDASCRFHVSNTNVMGTFHAYIDFSVNDNTNKDNVKLQYDSTTTSGKVGVEYTKTNGWTITIFSDTTSADINEAIKKYLAEEGHAQYPQLRCTAMQIPSDMDRKAALFALAGRTDVGTGTAPAIPATFTEDDVGTQQLYGAQPKDLTGMFDFAVKEPGEFANNYKVQFAYKSGYGATSAAWEENTLTVNICTDSTIADVNMAIRRAANGDPKKMMEFYDITGLDYGAPLLLETSTEGAPTADQTITNVYSFPLGFTATVKYDSTFVAGDTSLDPSNPLYYDHHEPDPSTATATWVDRYGNEVTQADVLDAIGAGATLDWTAYDPDDLSTITISKLDLTEAAADPERYVWNVGIRKQYFGDNPAVSPMDGKDSFFTKTAKSLSTFNLQDGRLGEEQAMHNFEDYMILQDGTIIGLHKIFGYMTLGRVDIATFDNPNGLAKVGGTNFKETAASGPAYINRPGENGAGLIVPNALEMSNVDLADEFTNMIATQRGYQANSRVVTVSDTMIEELLNLKR